MFGTAAAGAASLVRFVAVVAYAFTSNNSQMTAQMLHVILTVRALIPVGAARVMAV
jgi:hypothetical protein